MHLFLPPIDIGEDEGFTPQNDLFNREAFGESLAHLVLRLEDALVIGLDAPWGEGKTTFIKQWRGLLSKEPYSINSIYFDAFSHDYSDDPMSILADEFYKFIAQQAKEQSFFWKNQKRTFLENARGWIANQSKILLTAGGVGAGAAMGAIAGGGPESAALASVFESSGKELGQKVENYLQARQRRKGELEGFTEALHRIGKEVVEQTKKPLVFIVDELDRCRPDFALDLLERIKHVFSVPGIVFVLVYNSDQIKEHIKCRYGTGVNAGIYLYKFIHVTTHLPKRYASQDNYRDSDVVCYVRYLNEKMELNISVTSLPILERAIQTHKFSLRDTERLFTLIAIIMSTASPNKRDMSFMIFGVSLLHLVSPGLLNKHLAGEDIWEEAAPILTCGEKPGDQENKNIHYRFKHYWSTLLNRAIPEGHRESIYIADFWNNNDALAYFINILIEFLPASQEINS